MLKHTWNLVERDTFFSVLVLNVYSDDLQSPERWQELLKSLDSGGLQLSHGNSLHFGFVQCSRIAFRVHIASLDIFEFSFLTFFLLDEMFLCFCFPAETAAKEECWRKV